VIRQLLMAGEAREVLIAALEFDRDDVGVGVVMKASRFVIDVDSVNLGHT
jgi:hypothetical protein